MSRNLALEHDYKTLMKHQLTILAFGNEVGNLHCSALTVFQNAERQNLD